MDRPEQARACTQASRRAGRPAADKQVATTITASLAAKNGGKFYMLSSLGKNTNFDGFRDPRFAACSGSTLCGHCCRKIDPTRESLLLLQLQLLPPQCTLARNFKTDFCAPWSRCRNSAAFHQKLKVPSPAVVASGGTGLWMPSWNLPVVFSNRLFKWVALPT